ncbi:hypothetical protein K0E99_03790 [Bacteroides fragilis]|nr:hypothetical protein [Bacteroides fragilis]MCE8603345.1 hypothetical protein [Bacteroides fragilis]MCE8607694.1 hypothetical protein [Bacteroides fragilis]MCE8665792.1 hypothetical protein [Bacteroides fragilis]MCE8668938.1 hypothetical protein [Bacteroides fragilis]
MLAAIVWIKLRCNRYLYTSYILDNKRAASQT